MVGDPKHLSDLARIDASLSVRCRSCGHRRVYDRAMLETHLCRHGGIPAWSALAQALPCRCGSRDLSLRSVPYAREVRDPEQRPHERILVALALTLLEQVGARVSGDRADTVAVRLALRALLPHVAHRGTLASIWQSAGTENPLVRATGYEAGVASVRHQLVMMGRLD